MTRPTGIEVRQSAALAPDERVRLDELVFHPGWIGATTKEGGHDG